MGKIGSIILIILIVALFSYVYALEEQEKNRQKELLRKKNHNFELPQDIVKIKANGNLQFYFLNIPNLIVNVLLNNEYSMIIVNKFNNNFIKIVKFLKRINIKKLNYLILSDYDKEDFNYIKEFIKEIKISQIYVADYLYNSSKFDKLNKLLEEENIKVLTLKENDSFLLGTSKIDAIKIINKTNSIILRVIFGNNSFTLMDNVSDKISLEKDISSDLIKFNYVNSSNQLFWLEKTKAKYAIIMTNEELNKNMVKFLRDKKTVTYRSDREGTISIKSDGEDIVIRSIDFDFS